MARVGVHRDPAETRDAALRRIRLTRGWMIAAAAGLTAGLAALASALLPGKSLGAKTGGAAVVRTTATPRPGGTPALPSPAGASQLGVGSGGGSSESVTPPTSAPQPATPQPAPQQAAPAPAPQPAPSGGGVVSGGS